MENLKIKLPNNITYNSMVYCYQNILIYKNIENTLRFGYLEACLQTCGALDITNNMYNFKVIREKTFFRKEQKETYQEYILRLAVEHFESVGIDYKTCILDNL